MFAIPSTLMSLEKRNKIHDNGNEPKEASHSFLCAFKLQKDAISETETEIFHFPFIAILAKLYTNCASP